MQKKTELQGRAMGCLLAGAAGDALGAPVEFADRQAIQRRFGTGAFVTTRLLTAASAALPTTPR